MSWATWGSTYDDTPSHEWAIGTTIGASAGDGFSVGVTGFRLLNLKSQVWRSGRFIQVGAGAGIGIRAASISNFSWTSFLTANEMTPDQFAGFATIFSGEVATPIMGGNLGYLSFWGVAHAPYWIDIGGVSLGLSAGVAASLLCSCMVNDDPHKVEGHVGYDGPTYVTS